MLIYIQATVLLYLIMRGNFECFGGQRGFVRAHIQVSADFKM